MAKINYPSPIVLQPFSQSALYWQQVGRRTSGGSVSSTPEPDWEALVLEMSPLIWLRSDSGITISDTDKVDSLINQGTVAATYSATTTERPTYLPTGINGKPAIQQTTGQGITATANFSANESHTIFLVQRFDTVSGTVQPLWDFQSGRCMLTYSHTNTTFRYFDTAFVSMDTTFTASIDTTYVITATLSKALGTVVVRVNGVELGTIIGFDGETLNNVSSIGHYYNTKATNMMGIWSEYIVFDSLISELDKINVETYLIKKYIG